MKAERGKWYVERATGARWHAGIVNPNFVQLMNEQKIVRYASASEFGAQYDETEPPPPERRAVVRTMLGTSRAWLHAFYEGREVAANSLTLLDVELETGKLVARSCSDICALTTVRERAAVFPLSTARAYRAALPFASTVVLIKEKPSK